MSAYQLVQQINKNETLVYAFSCDRNNMGDYVMKFKLDEEGRGKHKNYKTAY